MDPAETDKIASCQKSLPSTQDPGWNDPPKWAFNPKPESVAASTTPVKRLLNKRVAFPLNSNPAASNANESSSTEKTNILPPSLDCTTKLTTTPHAPITAPSSVQEAPEVVDIDKEESLRKSITNLESVIAKYIKEESRAEELRRRLEMMKSMWKEKLSLDVCNKVYLISEALKNEDVITADKLHIALMMEHASICSSWIPCIRQLIQKLKENSFSVSEITQNASYLIPNSS